MSQSSWNRRTEPRHECSGQLLRWRTPSGRRKRRAGWLNDVSTNGLSFLVNQEFRPRIGEGVDLASVTVGEIGACRVVRLVPMDGNMLLVGCKRFPPGPGLSSGVQPALIAA